MEKMNSKDIALAVFDRDFNKYYVNRYDGLFGPRQSAVYEFDTERIVFKGPREDCFFWVMLYKEKMLSTP